MSTSAIIMLLFGLGITWGGAITCFCIAFREDQSDHADKGA